MSLAEFFLRFKALVILPLITKYFGPFNFGIWSQITVIVSLLSPLVFVGMETAMCVFLPGKSLEQQQREFTGWFLFGLLTSGILCGLVFIFRYPILGLFFAVDREYLLFTVLAGFSIVSTSLLSAVRNWFRVRNNAWALVTFTVLQSVLQVIVLIIVLVAHLGLRELVVGTLVSEAVLIVFYGIYLFHSGVFVRPSFAWFKPWFRFGIVLIPSGYALWIVNTVDRVILVQFTSFVDIGVYAIGVTLGYSLIQVVVNPIWNLFPTKAAELYNLGRYDDINLLVNQSIQLICWIIFPAVFGFIIVGEYIVEILSTHEFRHGAWVIPIILTSYTFLMVSAYFEMILSLRKKPYLSTLFTIAAGVINILLNLIWIPKYSYVGAAMAKCAAFLAQFLLSFVFVRREMILSLNREKVLRIALSSTIMFYIIASLKGYISHWSHLFSLGILMLVGLLSHLALSKMLNIFSFQGFKDLLIKG